MKVVLGVLILFSVSFTGCMMGGMGMMGMEHGQAHDETNSVKAFSKEVIISNYKLEVEFTIPKLHGEEKYNLRIYDRITNEKVNQAEVWFEVNRSGEGNSTNVEKLVSTKIETNGEGIFSSSFTFHSEEEIHVGFRIYSIENERFATPVDIFSNQKAVAENSGHGSGTSFTPIWIVGAVTMLAMMVFIHI